MTKTKSMIYCGLFTALIAAGAVIISIPVAILFLCTQKYYVEGVSGAVKG